MATGKPFSPDTKKRKWKPGEGEVFPGTPIDEPKTFKECVEEAEKILTGPDLGKADQTIAWALLAIAQAIREADHNRASDGK